MKEQKYDNINNMYNLGNWEYSIYPFKIVYTSETLPKNLWKYNKNTFILWKIFIVSSISSFILKRDLSIKDSIKKNEDWIELLKEVEIKSTDYYVLCIDEIYNNETVRISLWKLKNSEEALNVFLLKDSPDIFKEKMRRECKYFWYIDSNDLRNLYIVNDYYQQDFYKDRELD